MGMRVVSVGSASPRAQLEALLRESDVVSLHVRLTPATHKMIGAIGGPLGGGGGACAATRGAPAGLEGRRPAAWREGASGPVAAPRPLGGAQPGGSCPKAPPLDVRHAAQRPATGPKHPRPLLQAPPSWR